MASWFIILNLILLLQSSILQARLRAPPKRRHSVAIKPSVAAPISSKDDSVSVSNDGSLRESSATLSNQANEQQIEQFARLLIDRLNLKEPPNVTSSVDDGAGIPSSIVKQLEKQTEEQEALHRYEEVYNNEKQDREKSLPTTERAILPGHRILHNTCQRQIANRLRIKATTLNDIDCFHFLKSSSDAISLPNDQVVTKLRIYVKKSYFHLDSQQESMMSPDMFQLYQVYRPKSNDTTSDPISGLTETRRLSISQIKQLSDDWFELTIDQTSEKNNIQQIYSQFMSPWYGLAINRAVEKPWSHSYRHYQSNQRFERLLRLNHDENMKKKKSDEQSPYMLVEYGNKILSSGGRRSVRGAQNIMRPAQSCDPKSPCCRRSLTIDLDQGSSALNFVIYPRKLDIGECIGLCGASGTGLSHTKVKNDHYKNPKNSAYNLILMNSNTLFQNKSSIFGQGGRAEDNTNNCCSYSRTGGIELMYRTTNTGPVVRKFIPNIIVEECRCGLSALV